MRFRKDNKFPWLGWIVGSERTTTLKIVRLTYSDLVLSLNYPLVLRKLEILNMTTPIC